MIRISTRLRIAILVAIITPAGFGLKFYAGPYHVWANNYGAAVLYEVFWILVLLFFFPRKKNILRISAGVFMATSLLEILQLWHPAFLEILRSTFLGRALLGTTFVWWDFPHYVLGCALGGILARMLLSHPEKGGG